MSVFVGANVSPYSNIIFLLIIIVGLYFFSYISHQYPNNNLSIYICLKCNIDNCTKNNNNTYKTTA